MRIGADSGGAPGEDGPAQVFGDHHGALHVHMGVDVTGDQIAALAVIGAGGRDLRRLARLHNQMLCALPFFRKAARHGTVILLADDSLYLIQIKTAETKLVIAQLLQERCFCFQPILPLLVYTLNAYNAPYQFFLIQIVPGKAVQLLNDEPLQCIHGNKGAGAGIPRRTAAGTLQIVLPTAFCRAHGIAATGA